MAQLAPEVITRIGTFPITNTIIDFALINVLIFVAIFFLNKGLNAKKPNMFQNIIEFIVDAAYKFTEQVAGENAKQIFPYFATFFLVILLANWSGLIPGINTFGIWHGEGSERELIPFFRNATSDINLTLALALVSFAATHMLGIRKLGLKGYVTHFFAIDPWYLIPVFAFVGFLEVISEITKVISLSFRLFGNIYAGEVVIHTIFSLFGFLLPIPFLLLEMIVGIVQSMVFSILTLAFMSILMTPHHEDHAEA